METENDTDITQVMHILRDIVKAIDNLRDSLPVKDTMTITDISRKLGVAQSTMYLHPWNIPNFGKSDIGNNPRRWRRSTVNKWYSVPEAERREQWEAMTDNERREALT